MTLSLVCIYLKKRQSIKKLQVETGRLKSDLSQIKSRANSLLRALDSKADTDITRIHICNYTNRLSNLAGSNHDK